MINDYKIIVSTTVSSAVVTGYEKIIRPALLSWATPDFVDEVMVLDGMSIDNTREVCKCHEKVRIVDGPYWPIDSWSEENCRASRDALLNEINSISGKKIWCLLQVDNVAHDGFVDLYEISRGLIETSSNTCKITYKKAIGTKFLSNNYPINDQSDWYIFGAHRLADDSKIENIVDDTHARVFNGNNHKVKNFRYTNWRSLISYDMFFFTRQNLLDKLKKHPHYKTMGASMQLAIDEYVSKLKRLGYVRSNVEEHPIFMKKLFDEITDEHFAYDLFGNIHQFH